MEKSKCVLALGIDKAGFSRLADELSGQPYQLVEATSYRQIIEGAYFALIIKSEKIKNDEAETLQRFFREEDGASTTKLFLTDQEDALAASTNAQLFRGFEELLDAILPILKKSHDRARRQEGLTRSIAVSFYVDEQIKKQPGISTAELASQLKRSEPAVKRYIEELRMAGRKIAYDYSLEGWKVPEE